MKQNYIATFFLTIAVATAAQTEPLPLPAVGLPPGGTNGPMFNPDGMPEVRGLRLVPAIDIVFVGRFKGSGKYLPPIVDCFSASPECQEIQKKYRVAKNYREYFFEVIEVLSSKPMLQKTVSVIDKGMESPDVEVGEIYEIHAATFSRKKVAQAYVDHANQQIKPFTE
jgi:hypothetical protein